MPLASVWTITTETMNLLSTLASFASLAAAQSWPNGPFTTSGRDILDASGNVVTYAGANWPGAADVMIPEGLQYQSVANIVAKLKELNMNVIRLTYAIELIDQIYENGGVDIPISQAFVEALGETNGTAVYKEVLAANPDFSPNITRLEASAWTALTSMSLRNEPRTPADNTTLADETYNWEYWYEYVKEGASSINTANPDPLIFLSGLDFDTWLTPVVEKTALTPGNGTFSYSDFPANKMVLELHNYENSVSSCSSLESSLYSDGFEALNTTADVNHFPVVVTEWGFEQDNTTWLEPYTQCLEEYLPAQKAGWMIWVLAGSYYIRSGSQDFDETWGLLTHDWIANGDDDKLAI
ncbi:hypothetical protein SLS53_007167 [Cytospora paraplurivora]|uniref:Glycoside hydrolase family 5 domain-containing protein n=1 Tax=Cytospora paraplurivora TaxID=2898453 RepID=A0AAN9YCP8_9PEZI